MKHIIKNIPATFLGFSLFIIAFIACSSDSEDSMDDGDAITDDDGSITELHAAFAVRTTSGKSNDKKTKTKKSRRNIFDYMLHKN
ncbi:MAG: hypothetical protein AAFO99_16325 [Bacteroidota bacterium]